VPLNVIILEFEPIVRFGDAEMRLETLALALVLVVSLLVAGLIARATPAGSGPGELGRSSHLRPEDLLFVALGILPGAALGGRIGYGLIHLDYYRANPGELMNPAQGNLELTLAVLGGTLTAAYVLRLLDAPVGRWAHVSVFPLLLALGGGKLSQVLGGDGQGLPSDLPWATVYVAEGPWGSLAPALASHPAQVYEGIITLVILQVMTVLVGLGLFRRKDGAALLVGVAAWAVARAVVATTWRDATVLGSLRAEQLIALAVAAGCILLLGIRLLVSVWAARRSSSTDASGRSATASAAEAAGSAGPAEPEGVTGSAGPAEPEAITEPELVAMAQAPTDPEELSEHTKEPQEAAEPVPLSEPDELPRPEGGGIDWRNPPV